MTQIYRSAVAAAVLFLLVIPAAPAQRHNPEQTQINIQYHEMIPAGADSSPTFLKIFDRMRHDCELIGKAFSRKCAITQININVNTNYGGDAAGLQNLNANATMTLSPDATTP